MSTNTNTEKVIGCRGAVDGANGGANGSGGSVAHVAPHGSGSGSGGGATRAGSGSARASLPRVSLHCWTSRGYPCYIGVFQTKTAARRTARQLVRDGYAFSYDIRNAMTAGAAN